MHAIAFHLMLLSTAGLQWNSWTLAVTMLTTVKWRGQVAEGFASDFLRAR